MQNVKLDPLNGIDHFEKVDVSNSVTSGDESVYAISFIPDAKIPEDGYIFIEVPPSIELIPDNVKSSGSCKKDVQCEEVIVKMFPLEEDSYGQIIIKVKEEIPANAEYVFELGGVVNPRNTALSDIFVVNSFHTDKIQ